MKITAKLIEETDRHIVPFQFSGWRHALRFATNVDKCCIGTLVPDGVKHVLSAVLQPCSSISFCSARIKKHSVTFQFNGLRFIASHLKMILDSY